MSVDRCLCHDVSFARLKRCADARGGADLETLQRTTGCGRGCGLCVPYILEMLRTGRTSFEPFAPSGPEVGRTASEPGAAGSRSERGT